MIFAETFLKFKKKNIDRTLFERGNVLKLPSYGPNNKKQSWNLWWRGCSKL